jgi:hypothetical protein
MLGRASFERRIDSKNTIFGDIVGDADGLAVLKLRSRCCCDENQ